MMEYEPIIREIMEIEERIARREAIIKELEEKMAKRREETGLTHRELYRIDPEYRSWANSLRSYRGWNTSDRKRIEELKKLLPPVRALYQIMTFSIETRRGHEGFFAEVTCETVIPYEAKRREIAERVLNACLKYFFIMFDSLKCVTKDLAISMPETYKVMKDLIDKFWDVYSVKIRAYMPEEEEKAEEVIRNYKEILKKHPYVIMEESMDSFIKSLSVLGCFARPLDEFVTRETIIKVGVSYDFASVDAEPRYPEVYLIIEKGKGSEVVAGMRRILGLGWIILAKIRVADRTDVDMLDVLRMRGEM